MYRLKGVYLCFTSATSICVGIYIGKSLNHDEINLTVGDKRRIWTISSALQDFVPIPNVHAKSIVQSSQNTGSTVTNAHKYLMKMGYPSYENIRTFTDHIVSYDRRNRIPNWVLEHLTKEKIAKSNDTERKEVFNEDLQIHPYFRSTNDDYKKSGYDRGHMAAAGNHRWSQDAIDNTFYLSNIAPQVGKGFNRDAWNTLEKQVRHLVRHNKNVYVVTGPLYLPRRESDGKTYVKYEVIGRNHVSVPTHFYKVVLCENDLGEYQLFSFVMPNKSLPEKIELRNYLVPIDSIERAAGFLFFNSIAKDKLKLINGKSI